MFILRITSKDKFFSNHRFFDENGGFWSVQENQSPSDYFDGQNDEDNHEKLKCLNSKEIDSNKNNLQVPKDTYFP